MPIAAPIVGKEELGHIPFIVLADGGFALTNQIITTFPERAAAQSEDRRRFNQRLSR
jgi:hypothetical protein